VGIVVRHWWQRPDLRDWFLILIGILALLLGYAYGVARVPHGVRTSLSTGLSVMPLRGYAALWAAAGAYCIVAGFTARRIGGFTVASFMFTLWGMVYLIGWLHGDPGRGWVTAAIFAGFAGAIYCVSGLVDPTPIVERDAE
jgi:hypothetical protein